MHQTDAPPAVLTRVRFGFGDSDLFVRFDGTEPFGDYLAEGFEVALAFLQPPGLRVTVRHQDGAAISRRGRFKTGDPGLDRSRLARVRGGRRGTSSSSPCPATCWALVPGIEVQFFVVVARRRAAGR